MVVLRDHESIVEIASLPGICDRTYELGFLINAQLDALREYECDDFSALLNIVVIELGDELYQLEKTLGRAVTRDLQGAEQGLPYRAWESVERYSFWYVAIFVLSDDGFGMVVYIPTDMGEKFGEICKAAHNTSYAAKSEKK